MSFQEVFFLCMKFLLVVGTFCLALAIIVGTLKELTGK